MKAPLDSANPQDWDVYHDWCLDHAPGDHADLVWRIIFALEMKPVARLLLDDNYTTWPVGESWSKIEKELKIRNEYIHVPHWDWGLRLCRLQGGHPRPSLMGTPAHYPGLVEKFPFVAWEFFCHIVAPGLYVFRENHQTK